MDDILALAKGGLAKPSRTHKGPIHSAVAGRTDHLPMTLSAGSYVIPADIVSALGEGNTAAGFQVLKAMFSSIPSKMPAKANGGPVEGVPIVAAGGEFVVTPQEVEAIGEGDMDTGHKALDRFVTDYRAKTIGVLRKLAPPRTD